MVSAILATAGAKPHNELSSLFSIVTSQNWAQGEKNLPILHYIVPHKRESIYPIGGNRMVILIARRGENAVLNVQQGRQKCLGPRQPDNLEWCTSQNIVRQIEFHNFLKKDNLRQRMWQFSWNWNSN